MTLDIVIVGVYVDDILTTGSHSADVQGFRAMLKADFKMESGGPLEFYLGIKVTKSESGITTMDQDQYLRQKYQEFSDWIGPGGSSSPLPHDYLEIIENHTKHAPDGFPYAEMTGSLM